MNAFVPQTSSGIILRLQSSSIVHASYGSKLARVHMRTSALCDMKVRDVMKVASLPSLHCCMPCGGSLHAACCEHETLYAEQRPDYYLAIVSDKHMFISLQDSLL